MTVPLNISDFSLFFYVKTANPLPPPPPEKKSPHCFPVTPV